MASKELATDLVGGESGHPGIHNDIAEVVNLIDYDLAVAGETGQVLAMQPSGLYAPMAVASGTVMHPYILVAASDQPDAVKENADYVCDGTADQEQINAAIEDAAQIVGYSAGSGASGEDGEQRARVQLSGGRFNISDSILIRTGVTLAGLGTLTEIRAVSMTADAMIMFANVSVHKATLRDFWLHGNYASGGTTASGIYLKSGAGDDQNTYPPSGNDPEIRMLNLDIWGFRNNANRHGIVVDTDVRMTTVHNCYLREIGGHAIWFISSPDSAITDCHIGGVDGNGIYIQGANNRIANTKAFYCDGWGFEATSGYVQLSNVEVQDSENGFRFAGQHALATGILADTNDTVGIEIAANGVVLNGFQVACRSGGRYPNTDIGILFTNTPNNCSIVGRVNATNVTTRVSGATDGTANFVRITGGDTLIAEG